MVDIPMKLTQPLTRQTILSINQIKIQKPKNTQNISSINASAKGGSAAASFPSAASGQKAPQHPVTQNPPSPAVPVSKPIPRLYKKVQKGQKAPLETAAGLTRVKACLGWNTLNGSCDVDVSAFLLNSTGRVIGDSWFVFYGQETSPDGSTVFSVDQGADREIISIDFSKLDSRVAKIVFVLTINEALEKRLNFSMLKDAYIRILDGASGTELVSFLMDEYYANVTSMMIGELYQYRGAWKFNAVGNGVARDLAGLCDLYGVQVV